MKKLVLLTLTVGALTFSSISVFAAPRARALTNNTQVTSTLTKEQEQVLINEMVANMKTRKTNLKTRLDSGLITKAQYDIAVANIDARINDLNENGFSYGYGGGACGIGGGAGGCGMGGGYYR